MIFLLVNQWNRPKIIDVLNIQFCLDVLGVSHACDSCGPNGPNWDKSPGLSPEVVERLPLP